MFSVCFKSNGWNVYNSIGVIHYCCNQWRSGSIEVNMFQIVAMVECIVSNLGNIGRNCYLLKPTAFPEYATFNNFQALWQ